METNAVKSRSLTENLPRYLGDYEAGVRKYFNRQITIDELLEKRDDYYSEQRWIAESREHYFSDVAELCASTAQYLEYLP
jgi:hypothetical protein